MRDLSIDIDLPAKWAGLAAAIIPLWLTAGSAVAQDATWVGGNGVDPNEWVEPLNWNPNGVPSGTATFTNTGTTTVANDAGIVTIGALSFTSNAQAYTFNIDNPFIINGAGVTNSSTNTQTFNVTSGNSLVFQNGSTANNGTGAVTYNNDFFIFFENTSNAGNANTTFINNEIVQFSDTSSAGSANFTNNVQIDFFDSTTASNANITNNATGTITFNNTATAANATIDNAGGLQFNNSSTAGNATITNNASLTFNDSSTAGSANITTNTGGQVTFDAASTGGTASFVFNGTGSMIVNSTAMTAGSIASNSVGSFITLNNLLTVGGNNASTTFAGVIQGGGGLDKVGTGTLTLTNAGNIYGGATTVDQGILSVMGSIGSSSGVTINSGGTLDGTGIVSSVMVNSGGTLMPGLPAAVGTLNISGNLAFQSGAVYLVQVTPGAASEANVSGTAMLAGTVEALFAPGAYTARQYDILHAAGGLGGTTFTGATTANLPPGFATALSYSATDVFLNLTAQLGNQSGLNQNQQNVANAINGFFNSGGALPPGFFNVFGLTGPSLGTALTQLSGEEATDSEKGAFQLMNEFLSLLLDPFVDGRSGGAGGSALGFAPEQQAFPPDIALAYDAVLKAPPPAASFDQRWTAWGASYGGYNKTNGDPVVGSNNVNVHTIGFAGGMDYHFSPDAAAGFALAGGGTNWGLAQGLGTGRSDAFQAGVYGTTRWGPAYVAAALAYTNNWMSTNRIALGDQLTARFDGQSYGGRIEAGYRYAVRPTVGLTPYAAAQAQSFHTPSYSETDVTGGGFGLSYNAMSASDARSELGARFDDLTMLGTMPVVLRARVAWAHDWVSNPLLGAVFQALPGASFTVNGATLPHDSALTTAQADLHVAANWLLSAKFDGEFAKGSQTYAGTGTLRYSW